MGKLDFLEFLSCLWELGYREILGENVWGGVGAALLLRSLSGFLRDLRGANRKPFAREAKALRQPQVGRLALCRLRRHLGVSSQGLGGGGARLLERSVHIKILKNPFQGGYSKAALPRRIETCTVRA